MATRVGVSRTSRQSDCIEVVMKGQTMTKETVRALEVIASVIAVVVYLFVIVALLTLSTHLSG